MLIHKFLILNENKIQWFWVEEWNTSADLFSVNCESVL